MNGVQCYELFGGIALKNHTFSFSFSNVKEILVSLWVDKKQNTDNILSCYIGNNI